MALDLDLPVNCTSFKTRQLARLVARHFDAELASFGLKSTQYTLLTHVFYRGPLSTKDLAQRMGLGISTLTRNLKPLLDQQWVQQSVGSDARTRIVAITPLGEVVQTTAHGQWKTAQRSINAIIGTSAVLELHTHMNQAIEKLKPVDRKH